MQNLEVNTDYLAKLAQKQDDARDAFASADSHAAGLADSVKETHGVVSGDFANALTGCEQTLKDLLAKMHDCADRLAHNLKQGANAYEEADRNAF